MTPAATRASIVPGGWSSGARVTRVLPRVRLVSSGSNSASRRRSTAPSWMPFRAGFRNGPSRWMPSRPGVPLSMASDTARRPRRTTSSRSLIRVGSKPVVPNRRCARPMAATPSGVGVSLNSTPPPPFTWTSMKPGSRHCPPRSRRGTSGGRSAGGPTKPIRPPARPTARPSHSPASVITRPSTRARSISGPAPRDAGRSVYASSPPISRSPSRPLVLAVRRRGILTRRS